MIKILILSANPRDTPSLRLAEEFRDIKAELDRSLNREYFQLFQEGAVRVTDLTRALASHAPHIVQFSGHGGGRDGLAFEDDGGHVKLVSTEALADLFSLHKNTLKCVFLNACYSKVQAEEIHQHINCVVGMSQRIGDEAAKQFAVTFYQALFSGQSFFYTYRLATTALDLVGSDESKTPKLLIREKLEDPLDIQKHKSEKLKTELPLNEKIKTRRLIVKSPYKGLEPFDLEDKNLFFGRDQFLERLIDLLKKTNLVVLLGASGSGKSSVIRAGLFPLLKSKASNNFISLKITPDRDPFESFYGGLLGCGFKQSQAELVRVCKVDTLHQVIKALKKSDEFWFILIDQFEELFTISEPSKRDRFIQAIVKLSRAFSRDPKLKIVVTMRADFLDRLDPSPANLIVRVTEGNRPMITQMHVDELRLAIEQPAAQHGVVFETGLVEEITNSVLGQAGYLPLLQYTLDLLWKAEYENRGFQDRTLHIQTYRQLGGVRGALQQQVDQIYSAFPKAKKIAAQRIFLRLVSIDDNTALTGNRLPVRRRAKRSEFTDETEKQVLSELINTSLLVSDNPDSEANNHHSTVEIAHEILFASWKTLENWIQEHWQAVDLRNRLNEDLGNWQDSGKSDTELWGGVKLEKALELRSNAIFNQFSEDEKQFIDKSISFRDRQRRKTILSLTGFSAFALTLAGFAGVQWRQAEIGETRAIAQTSEVKFAINKLSLDPLVDALVAGDRFQNLLLANTNTLQIKSEVVRALSQSLFNIKEINRFIGGHSEIIQSVSFAPDGQTIATASFDKTAKLWDLTGQEIATLAGHDGEVTNVDFSPDGGLIVTSSFDQTAKIWTSSGKEIVTLKGHTNTIWSARFSPDGQTIATTSDDSTVRFWHRDGRRLPLVLKGSGGGISSISFSPDGTLMATANDDGTIELWNQQGERLHTLSDHQSFVLHVSFSNDSKNLVSTSVDKKVLLWDLNNVEKTPVFLEHTDIVSNAIFSPDDQFILTASDDSTIKIWNRRGVLTETLEGHSGSVTSLSLQPKNVPNTDGILLASASNDKTVRLWQLASPRIQQLVGHNSPVYAVKFFPDSHTLATAGRDSKVVIWNEDNENKVEIAGHKDRVYELSISSDGQLIASASADGTVHILNKEGQLLTTLQDTGNKFLGVSFSPTEKKIATASTSGIVKIWDLEGNILSTLEGHDKEVHDVNFSPDGKKLVTAGIDGTVKLWAQNGRLLNTLDEPTGSVYRAVFSPDSQFIVAGSEDNLARVWTTDGELVATLEGHAAAIGGVAVSPDSQIIATASDDGTAKLWQKNGALISTLVGSHTQQVNVVDFSSDGNFLATGGADNKVIKWNIKNLTTLSGLMEEGCKWISDYQINNRDRTKEIFELEACN